MSTKDPLLAEVSELVIKAMDDEVAADEFARLQHLLRTDATAREYFFDIISTFAGIDEIQTLHLEQINQNCSALLKTLAQEETRAPAIEMPQEEPELIQTVQSAEVVYTLSKRSLFTLAASVAAILFLVVVLRLTPPDRPALVARLTRTVDAQWENAVGAVQTGTDLYAGPMRLAKGLAEITFDGGATVVMEAPADFSLQSAQQILLERGRLVARIDKQSKQTFVVCCPFASVVDYGTEFGVDVNPHGLRTYVFNGKVALRSSVNPIKFDESIELTAGEGGIATPDQMLQKTSVDERQFVRSEEFGIRLKAAQGSDHHRWLLYSRQIRKRSDLALYFAFDEDSTQSVGSVKAYTADSALLNGQFQTFKENGQFAEWVPGRFPGKPALRFRRSELNGIKVQPDPAFCISGPITIAAWVYFPDASTIGGHLVICRDLQNVNYQFSYFDETYYEPQHDRFEFNRYRHDDGATREGFNYYSQKYDMQAGQWYHLAVTHDGEMIGIYVNGKAVDMKSNVLDAEPVLTPLWIGPCMEDERQTLTSTATRGAFNGILDELVILHGALSEPEVRQLYEAGKP